MGDNLHEGRPHESEKPTKGTFLRGPDGELYFIRDEVLKLCRIEGADVQHAEAIIGRLGDQDEEAVPEAAAKDAGFSIEEAHFEPLGSVQGKMSPMQVKLTTQSTIMCCWRFL